MSLDGHALCFGIDGKPISFAEWSEAFESPSARRIAHTALGEGYVSTIWLGLAHGCDEQERPLIFETMKFPEMDPVQRYATLDEAKEGHARMVAQLEAGAA